MSHRPGPAAILITWMVALATSLTVSALAAASARAADREGFLAGMTAGLGSRDCSGTPCAGFGLVFGGHLGVSLGPSLAVLGEASALLVGSDTLVHGTVDAVGVVQYWPTRRLWLGAGAGVGEGHEPKTQPVFVAQTGFELRPEQRFGLDLRGRVARIGTGSDGTTAIVVTMGFTWY